MANEREALALIEGLERASKKARPFMIAGLLALLIGVALVIYSLEQQRREAVERAVQAEELVKTLRAAQSSGSPELVSRALSQAQNLSASLDDSGAAPPAPAKAAATSPPARQRPAPRQREQDTAAAAAEPAPAQARQDAPSPVQTGGLRVTAATPNVDGYYIVRADTFQRLQNRSDLSAFGPRPLPDQVRTKSGVRYYLFPVCNGQVNMGQRQLIDGGMSQVTLRCP